jgi:hypothetical protein
MIPLVLTALALASPAHGHDPSTEPAPPDARAITSCVLTGSGEWTFESVAGWAKLPQDKPLGPTHGGVAIDKKGRVYVASDGPCGILVFAADGQLEKTIAEKFSGCHSLLLREEGGTEFLYAAHLAGHQTVKLRLDGTAVWTLGCPMESGAYKSTEEYHPTAFVPAPDGSYFVADGYGTSLIHKFDRELKWVKSFAGSGEGDGQCKTSHGLAIDLRGEKPLLLVCDRENRRLVRFDLDGKFVDTVAKDLHRPCSVAFLGKAIAVAELEGRVTILDEKGAVATHLGDNPEESERANFAVPPASWKDGIFTAPHGLAFDREGSLYVQDWNQSGRVSKLRRIL